MNESAQSPDRDDESIGPGSPASLVSQDSSLDLSAIWDTLVRNRWVVLITAVLITGGVAGYTWTLPRIYEASAMVSVERPPAAGQTAMSFNRPPDLESEIGILENSGELSRRVIDRLRTISDTAQVGPFSLFRTEDGTPVDNLTAYTRLQDMTYFQTLPAQSLIRISVESESPKEASVIANVFAEEYQSFNQKISREGVVAARRFLEDQLEKRKGDINEIERDWEQFARNNAVATEGQDGQQVALEFLELQSQRDAIEFQLEQEKRQLEVMTSQLQSSQPSLRENVLREQRVQSLRTQVQVLENQIAALKAEAEQFYINDSSLRGNEERIPELAEIKRRTDGFEARKNVLTEQLVKATEEAGLTVGDGTTALAQVGTLREQIQAQKITIGQLEAQLRGLDRRISQYQSRIKGIPRQAVQREQIDRRRAQAEQFFTDIAAQLQQTVIAEESELGYVKIVRTAITPMFPVRPNLKQNIVLGLLLGIGFGIGGAFVRQAMNHEIYRPVDIQRRGYNLVGVIPKMDRELKEAFNGEAQVTVEGTSISTSLFPLLNPWSPITENYRLMRANLRHAAQTNGKEPEQTQAMLVTSPEPGDGKTTSAVNLAITISMSGKKVLLIDADLRRPNCHKLLGLLRSPGLADVLEKNEPVKNQIQSTVVEGLSVLTAGKSEGPPTELLDSERMRSVIAAAREHFDVIVVDTPPVLAATDPIVLAPFCDTVMVVASANKTDFRALAQVQETFDDVGVEIGGVIFNRYDADRAGSGTKYGYGYDYKYDYSPTS